MPSRNRSPRETAAPAAGAAQDKPVPIKELDTTIHNFQSILTDDDRKTLQQLADSPHDAQSIIAFTTELEEIGRAHV